jgi:hypothetical protein
MDKKISERAITYFSFLVGAILLGVYFGYPGLNIGYGFVGGFFLGYGLRRIRKRKM